MGSELQAALIGALIGGFLSLLANLLSHHLQSKAADRAEKTLINGFIWSIHAEISELLARYMSTMGGVVEASKKDEPLLYHYPIHEEYFTIFNGNSELVGRITDSELRVMIVKLYIAAKGMVDTFRTNNTFVLEYEGMQRKQQSESTDIKAYKLRLCEYANIIRASHNEFDIRANILLNYIEETVPMN